MNGVANTPEKTHTTRMTVPSFLKKKRTYVVLLLLAAGGWWFYSSRIKNTQPKYESATAEKRDLAQTVEVTGEIKPAARIELAFKNSGTISKISVKVGDAVNKGDVLAELKADDVVFAERSAAAALSVADANLKAKLAGETVQSIRVAEAQVEQAQAAYAKSTADLESTKRTTQDDLKTAEIALQTAKNNLDNQNAIVNQNVQNAYDSARAQLLTALGPLSTGLSDGDQISGVDNTAANQSFVNVLGFLDSGSLDRSKSSYRIAKDAKAAAEKALNALNSSSTKEQIQAAAQLLQTAITQVQTYLTDVQKVLAASITSSTFTTTDLAAKKTTIDADRTSVSAQNTAVLTALQTIKNTELTKTQTVQQLTDAHQTALTAYDTAKTNVEVQVRTAETNVAIQLAALDSAKATLDLKRYGPRAVDLEPLRAAVQQAQVSHDKAVNDLQNVQIISAVTGTISEVLPDIGEQVVANAVAIRMVGTESYDIEAQVPEADITKVLVEQTAVITLDAYGDDVKFKGTVTAKDPAETRIQEAIYYKIRVQIEPGGKEVKPGMTANITVTTDQRAGVLVIPLRAVRTDADTQQKTVRVLLNGVPESRNVTLGLKGDEGRVEVVSGLSAGDAVIVGETGATP